MCWARDSPWVWKARKKKVSIWIMYWMESWVEQNGRNQHCCEEKRGMKTFKGRLQKRWSLKVSFWDANTWIYALMILSCWPTAHQQQKFALHIAPIVLFSLHISGCIQSVQRSSAPQLVQLLIEHLKGWGLKISPRKGFGLQGWISGKSWQ